MASPTEAATANLRRWIASEPDETDANWLKELSKLGFIGDEAKEILWQAQWSVEMLGFNWVVRYRGKVMGSYITADVAQRRLPELQEKYNGGVPSSSKRKLEWYVDMPDGEKLGPYLASKEFVRDHIMRKQGRNKRLANGTKIYRKER